MWYKVWGRYAWNSNRGEDKDYWLQQLSVYYGIKHDAARQILEAYDESGEIAPKLLRRFGITEGNRQTLLLGMKMSELVNPYKYTIYPGFYESCGPQGEKLIEYVEKDWKHQPHEGELPLDIVNQCVAHGEKALAAISAVNGVTRHSHEFLRLQNDMRCYDLFARSFRAKVLAAQQVLNYKWSKNVEYLDAAVPLLEISLENWRKLAAVTAETYLYANSMQTAQRRIPVGGDNGNFKTWTDMLPVYEEELEALKLNIAQLKSPKTTNVGSNAVSARPAKVRLISPAQTVPLTEGAVLFENREDTKVDTLAHELKNLQALVLNRDSTRIVGTTVEFECDEPVQLLVGFFQDDDKKWARPPKLEIDATGNEYGQAEPVLTNAIALKQMPPCNIHAYHLGAGHHKLNLPRGIIMVAGFTSDVIKPRDAALKGAGDEVDWLFMK